MPDFILCCDSLKPSPSRYCRNCGLGEILLRYNGGGLALANVREEDWNNVRDLFSFSNETLQHLETLIFTYFAETRIPCTLTF